MLQAFYPGLRRACPRSLVEVIGLLGGERGQWGAGDGGVGLHATGSQRQLHQPLTQGADVSLLEVPQSFILVDLPWAQPLYGGAPFGPHLLVGDTGYIKRRSNAGVRLTPEILRLDFGFFVGREVLTCLEPWRELLLHDTVVHLNLLALGLLASNMGPSEVVLAAQPFVGSPGAPVAGKRQGGRLVQSKEGAALVGIPISELLLQQTL